MKTLTNLTAEDLLLKDKIIIYAGKTETLEDNIADELLVKYPNSVVEAKEEEEKVKEVKTETKPKIKRKK